MIQSLRSTASPQGRILKVIRKGSSADCTGLSTFGNIFIRRGLNWFYSLFVHMTRVPDSFCSNKLGREIFSDLLQFLTMDPLLIMVWIIMDYGNGLLATKTGYIMELL